MTNKVTVLGSLNVDTTLRIKRMPQPGETLQTENKSSAAGGKGANQAVAAARAGAETSFIGKIGKDSAGQFMVESLKMIILIPQALQQMKPLELDQLSFY